MIDITLEQNCSIETDILSEEVFDIDLEEEHLLDVTLYTTTDEIFVEAQTNASIDVEVDIGTVINRGDYEIYDGPYVAVPTLREQVFETDNKAMNSDFRVKEITYLEVPNPSGGLTVTIGEM